MGELEKSQVPVGGRGNLNMLKTLYQKALKKIPRLIALWILVLMGNAATSSKSPGGTVFVLKISDAIHVGTEEYFHRGLQMAKANQSPALFIELDTPGGFLESTRLIVQEFLASELPIIVWVAPQGARAASAGSMITMAAHFAVMSDSTSIGAATPVSGDGKEIPKEMKQKITNDTLSFVEGIAQKRGRNVEWAKKSVSEAASVAANVALKENIIDAVANSRAEVWQEFRKKFKEAPESIAFQEVETSLREKTLSFLANPNVAYGLLGIGSLGIYLELSNPGSVVPGVVGVLALAMGAISMKIIPVRPGSIALFVIAMILLFIEFMTPLPTYGSAGVGAVIALFLSGVFWVNPEETTITLNPSFWIPAFLVIVLFVGYFLYSSVKALTSPEHAQGSMLLVGKEGHVTKIKNDRELLVLVDGALWNAEKATTDLALQKGDQIQVVDQKNLKLVIKRKET